MNEYWKSKLGWWPVTVLAVLGYLLPVYLIGIQVGLWGGVLAFVAPLIVVFDRGFGALQLFSLIAWLIYSSVVAVATIGWWSLAVFLAWGAIFYVLLAGYTLFYS